MKMFSCWSWCFLKAEFYWKNVSTKANLLFNEEWLSLMRDLKLLTWTYKVSKSVMYSQNFSLLQRQRSMWNWIYLWWTRNQVYRWVVSNNSAKSLRLTSLSNNILSCFEFELFLEKLFLEVLILEKVSKNKPYSTSIRVFI